MRRRAPCSVAECGSSRPGRAGIARAVGSSSTGCQLGRAGDHGHEPAAVADLGRPMASRRPAVQHRPGGDQLLPVRVDWAEEVDLHVEAATSVPRSAVVWTAAEADIPAGRWRPRRPHRTSGSAIRWPTWRTPPGLSPPQAGGCPSTGRTGLAARRGGWPGGFQAQTFPRAPGGMMEDSNPAPILLRRPRSER